MPTNLSEKEPSAEFDWILIGTFSVLAFLCLFCVLDPRLIYQQQQPVFFRGTDFFGGFTSVPGGLSDYVSAFLSQFLVYRFAGALLITGLLTAVIIASSGLLNVIIRPRRIPLLEFGPALALLALHANYRFPLSISLALLVSLSATYLFLCIPARRFASRTALFILCFSGTYWCTGSQAFLFAILCISHDFIVSKKYVQGTVCLLISAAVPWLTYSYLIIITFRKAFLSQSPFYYDFKLPFAPYFLYAVLILIFPLRLVLANPPKALGHAATERPRRKFRSLLVTMPVLALVIAALTGFSFDEAGKTSLTMDSLAQGEAWASLIKEMHSIMEQKDPAKMYPLYQNRYMLPFYVNRALYHKGILLDSMFAFWQLQPPAGMLQPYDLGEHYPLFCSDVYFDIGFVNASQRWAYEAYATSKTPRVLRRLGLACVCAGLRKDALRCSAMLEKTVLPQGATWSRSLAALCAGDTAPGHDDQVDRVRSIMPETDFIMHGIGDGQNLDLAVLFDQKRNNRMAFEYMLADYLLTYQPDAILPYIKYFGFLGYPVLPQHIQEALVFLKFGLKMEADLGAFKISDGTLDRFKDFMRILVANNGDMKRASKELFASYGDTYWFYLYSATPKK
jgi:hypothetical protein